MRARLTDPELIAERVSAYAEERAKLNRKGRAERVTVEKKLAEAEQRIRRLVEAIETSNEPVAALAARLAPLDRERVALAERLRLLQAETNVIELHPATLKQYRANVATLHKTLADDAMTPGHVAAIRAINDGVAVHPTDKRAPYEISTYGRLAGLLGVDVFPNSGPMPCSDTVRAGGPAPSFSIAIDDALDERDAINMGPDSRAGIDFLFANDFSGRSRAKMGIALFVGGIAASPLSRLRESVPSECEAGEGSREQKALTRLRA